MARAERGSCSRASCASPGTKLAGLAVLPKRRPRQPDGAARHVGRVAMRIARRSALGHFAAAALPGFARAAGKSVSVGINLPLTGAGAEDATNILHGALLAFEEANA